jgi:hypothetical protein
MAWSAARDAREPVRYPRRPTSTFSISGCRRGGRPWGEEALGDAVGTTAESTTTETRMENWARSMIPVLSPYVAEMVPKVRPVLISRVVNVACSGTQRRANGHTPGALADQLDHEEQRDQAQSAPDRGQ